MQTMHGTTHYIIEGPIKPKPTERQYRICLLNTIHPGKQVANFFNHTGFSDAGSIASLFLTLPKFEK
jgi:hypothetical protein